MAATATASRLTEAHRLAQARQGAQLVTQLLIAWRLLDPEDIDGTVARWLTTAIPLVQAARRTSARLAANYLSTFRALELGVDADRFFPFLAEDVPDAQVATSLIVTGPAALRAGVARGRRPVDIERIARVGAAAAGMRHALNGGRDTIIETVDADGAALGWARSTSGKPCGFCAMLASRGPVFKGDTVRFRAHDHCHCGVEPVYRHDAAWPAGSKRFQQMWRESTRGLSGGDARTAFRQAVEAER